MNKKGINDEFYTPAETIINELKWYGYDGFFKNKTIYLPCDYDATLPYIKKEIKTIKTVSGMLEFSEEVTIYKVMPELFTEEDKFSGPRNCQFVAYLTEHKEDFGIKDIYISGYDAISGEGLRFQDAPFEEFDVVITNPPFSQMQEWIEKIIDYSKKGGEFLFLAPLSILTNTFAFPFFKNADFWCGYTEPSKYEDASGNMINSYLPSVWLTNLEVKMHKQKRVLSKSWSDRKNEYLPFWNYRGINVNSIDDIPYDYSGVMGVPATFLKNIHPDQFEIIGLSQGKEQLKNLAGIIDKESEGYTTDMIRTQNTGGMYNKNKTTAGVASSKILIYTTIDLEHPFKAPFARVLIKSKDRVKDRKYYGYDDVVQFVKEELKIKKAIDIWDTSVLTIRKGGNVIAKKGKGESTL